MFEFLEDLCFREIELFSFRHISYFFFSVIVALFIFSVEFYTLVEGINKLRRFSFPQFTGFFSSSHNSIFTIFNHLISDLHE